MDPSEQKTNDMLREQRSIARTCFEHLWADGGVKIGIVDPHFPGLEVPEHVRENVPLVLMYEQRAVVPITDLETSEKGVKATLSFSRTPFETFVPWDAIVAMDTIYTEREEPKKRPALSLVP